ncbi:MAG TPA: hypothetical protein PLX06_10340 [Fimbriimonadaceae bacterium]|nr:hypothetical protein [Fimbriimonadaceae bacterium]
MKHRKILASIALVGCAVYLVGQATGIRSKGPQPGGGPGVAIASQSTGPKLPFQVALSHIISGHTNHLVDKATEERRDAVVSRIIEVQCAYVLSTLNPEQRAWEIKQNWEVDKYRPNGQWDHVTNAPQLAKALLKMNRERSERVRSIIDSATEAHWAPYREISKRLEEKGLSRDEQARQYNIELERFWGGRTKSERTLVYANRMLDAGKKIRETLSDAERTEWDAIVNGFLADVQKAYNGLSSANSPR